MSIEKMAGRFDSIHPPRPPVRGFIFDLDGTLVDSRLDFDAIRRDMGLSDGKPILEALEQLDPAHARHGYRILDRYERDGAERAVLLPGVPQLLEHLNHLDMQRAVVTRNSRAMAERMLSRCGLDFELFVTRDDGPVKPDPWAIHHICRQWSIPPRHAVVIGDFHFDIEAGKRAGAITVFLGEDRAGEQQPGAEQADIVIDSLQQANRLLRALGLPLIPYGPSRESPPNFR
jgi:HAD superfamily hydrolase (TIGR01509 family)